MDEVVATDGEAVTIARHLPNGHLGVSGFEAGSHSAATTMNGVEGIGVGIIGQTRAATNARNHCGLLRKDAQSGHCLEQHIEHGVVATARTPTDGLVVLIVERFHCLGGLNGLSICVLFHYNSSSIMISFTPSIIS